jgi:hypothetical protein
MSNLILDRVQKLQFIGKRPIPITHPILQQQIVLLFFKESIDFNIYCQSAC